jgi:hypothetical protein
MPLTIETRLRRVLIEMLENETLTPEQRLEAAQQLRELNGIRRTQKPKKPKPTRGNLLG